MTRYGVDLSLGEIRETDADDLEERLIEQAYDRIDRIDTAGVQPYLSPLFPLEELCKWANDKFAIGLTPGELISDETRNISKSPTEIVQVIEQRARDAYAKREVEYPVDHVLTLVANGGETIDLPEGAAYLENWAKAKYGLLLPAADTLGQSPRDLPRPPARRTGGLPARRQARTRRRPDPQERRRPPGRAGAGLHGAVPPADEPGRARARTHPRERQGHEGKGPRRRRPGRRARRSAPQGPLRGPQGADRPRAVRADQHFRPGVEGSPLRDGRAQGGHRHAGLRRARTRGWRTSARGTATSGR